MSNTLQQTAQRPAITSFFSDMQLRRLQNSIEPRQSPTAESYCGAFLFLDLVSFTKLGEELREQGPKGAEDLSGILHAYYAPILTTIRTHGGDVLYFAGDAFGVIWVSRSDDLHEPATRAAQCALAIQDLVPQIQSPWRSPLSFRASIGVGNIEAYEVGGFDDNWMQLVRGQAIDLACLADSHSEGGTVTLGLDCTAYLQATALESTPIDEGFLRLHSMQPDLPSEFTYHAPALEPELELSLGNNLTKAIRRHVSYPSTAFGAEFRQVTVVFGDISKTDLQSLHDVVRTAQKETERFEGVVYQLLEDDKGTGLIIVFGIPGTTHADDPLRAMLLAEALRTGFAAQDVGLRLGIATGTVFCGPLGTEARQQYSILGSTINLAARLMSLAKENQTLCDNNTRNLVSADFQLIETVWTTPKGFREPMAIFEAGKRNENVNPTHLDTELVGREAELAEIERHLVEVNSGGASRLLVIRADAGVGKSTLLQSVKSRIQTMGHTPLDASADSFETGTSYFAFRHLARYWCGLQEDDDGFTGMEHLQDKLADAPDLIPLIPLLGPIVGLEFDENELTKGLRGQLRSENTRRVLLHLAACAFTAHPAVLFIEDGHWMDGASWTLLEQLIKRIPELLVLLSLRPLGAEAREAKHVVDNVASQVLELKPVSRVETEEMIRRILGVFEVSAGALDLVAKRAEGNPLFIREIVRNLQETGRIRIRDSRVERINEDDDENTIPSTLNGVITSRIDRLPADVQITIKTAAVLGRTFDTELLLDIHPLSIGLETLHAQLQRLTENTFLEVRDEGERYLFHHALTRDAAYNLLAFAQRQSLHESTALKLEEKYSGNTDPVSARLGYHFQMANIPKKAAPYLAAAGIAAVDAYASRDAIELLTNALELDKSVRGNVHTDLTRTYWCRLIGQAYYNQDDQLTAADWYRQALEVSGIAPRFSTIRLVPTLLRAIVSPDSFDRPPSPQHSDVDRQRITQALGSGRELSIIYLWESATGRFALTAINMVRVARIVGPTNESGNAVAALAFLMSAAGLRKNSEKTAQQAVNMAESFGDLEPIVSVRVLAGMVMAQNGSLEKALPLFKSAHETSADLRTGLERHRCKYMLADTLTWLGRYHEAHKIFLDSAEIAHSAEPHTVGQATAMAALSLLRTGRPEEAVALLESPDGVPNAVSSGVPASAIMSLGILAEARLAIGQQESALATVEEAEAQATDRDDGTGFYSGLFGYASILRVRLQTETFGEARSEKKKTAVEDGLQRMGKLARIAPVGRAIHSLLSAMFAAHQGREKRAKRLLRQAIDAARSSKQPFELGASLVELTKLSSGSERERYLREALDIFAHHGLTLEHAKASALRT